MTTDEERLTVVNVVASTRVAEELDLPDIAIQLNCEYEPEQFPGVVYRVTDPKLAILMFRSGRAVCTGGKDEDNIHTGIDRMIADLRGAGIKTWDLADVEIEVQNLPEFMQAIEAEPDIIMLDNFSIDSMKEAVVLNQGRCKLEASGGIQQDQLVNIAKTGVNYISIGGLTKNCQAIDLTMLVL